MLTLLLLTSCIVPEKGIDNTRVVGTIRIEASEVDETSETANNGVQAPLEMDPLHFGYRVFNGNLLTSSTDDTTGDPNGDIDHWLMVSPTERGSDNPLAVDITLSDSQARARVRVFNLDETTGVLNEPTLVHEEDFTQWALVSFEAEADVNYSFGIYGLEGPDNTTYRSFVMGQHPDEANVLVGAYKNDDPEDRGSLLGGTNAKPWTQVDDLAFETWYEMLLVREFQSGDSAEIILDENVKQAYVYAGTWANLAQGLPAGTFFSRTPVFVDMTDKGKAELMGTPPGGQDDQGAGDTGFAGGGGDYEAEPLIRDTPTYPTVTVDDTVVIDRIADAVIGQVWDEQTTEPNDTDIYDAFTNPGGAFDLGMLSGPGFVDVIDNGTLTDNGVEADWGEFNDTFKFQVPAPTRLNFTLSWADPAMDFDVLLVDAEGNILDLGYYGFPEIPTYNEEVLQPGQDYYIAVLLWTGSNVANDEIPYDFTLEQLPE